MNEMDKLFGGTEEAPQEITSPDVPDVRCNTIAQTAAAVSRHRRASERMSLVREVCLVAGMLLLIGGGYFALRAYLDHKAAVERLRHENLMAEKARDEAADRARREEIATANQRAREEQAREMAERRRRQEEARAAEAAARNRVARFRAVKDLMRAATLDHFRNADDAERPAKVKGEATFLCLFPGDGADGCAFYEVKTNPGGKPSASRIFEDRDPEAVSEEAFGKLAAKKPYLILRDRGGTRNNLKAYLVVPTKARRAASDTPVPDATGVYCPARLDFGELYDAVRALGLSRAAFKYQVEFSAKALSAPVILSKAYTLNDTVTRAAVESAVNRAIRDLARVNRRQAASLPPLEDILAKGALSFRPVR
ncbi:MAG: hypothetical protein ACI4RA_10365 [Kiritimatiellia bacterium]